MGRQATWTKTKKMIVQHAKRLTSVEIGELAGVTPSHVRRVAGKMGVSLRKPPEAVNPKRIYWVSAPLDSQCAFAEKVQAIMEAKHLTSQSAALVWAVRFAAQALGEEGSCQPTSEG